MKWFHRLKENKIFQIAVALIAAVVVYYLLQHVRAIWNVVTLIWKIISPLVVGLVIAYIVDPLVRLLERSVFRKMKGRVAARRVSIAASVVIVIAFVVVVLWLLIPQLISSVELLISNISGYMTNLENWLKSIGNGVLVSHLGINFSDLGTALVKWLSGLISGSSIINASVSFGSGLVSFIMSAILAVYFLLSKNRLLNLTKKLMVFIFKERKYKHVSSFCVNCNKILVRYICTSLLEALAIGVANAIVMLIFGIPFVVLVSLVVGVCNLVPTFGPIAGGVIGGFILIMINPVYALIFIITTVVLQIIDGYVLKPRLFSETLGVSAILILVSIIVLGRILGLVGILLAIPIAAILQYLFKLLIRHREDKKITADIDAATAADIENEYKVENLNFRLDEEEFDEFVETSEKEVNKNVDTEKDSSSEADGDSGMME